MRNYSGPGRIARAGGITAPLIALAVIGLGESPPPPVPAATVPVRARIYDFPLRPTLRARAASGGGQLRLAPSPFGVPMTADGHFIYNLTVSTSGLRRASDFGPTATYSLWITSPDLDRFEKLGNLEGGEFRGRVSGWNKFIVMVTVEEYPHAEERRGPIVLRGNSPSGLLSSFASHELFNNMPHE